MKLSVVTLLALRLVSLSSPSVSATIMIIMFNHSFQQICIVLFFLGGYARWLICYVKSVQNVPTISKYLKLARHFICNWVLLILCFILCVLLFVYIYGTHSDSSSSVEYFSTMMIFDSSLFVEQICDQVLSTKNSFNSLSSVEQMCKVRICFLPVISIITG